MANLEALGFCGVDDSIHPRQLALIARCFPLVEFGVLFRPDKEGTPRYASPEWVNSLCAVAQSMAKDGTPMKLAAHLCGSRVNEVLAGNTAFLQTLRQLGFARVQINATAVNGVDTSDLASAVSKIHNAMKELPHLEFILQKNEETRPLWEGMETIVKETGQIPNLAMLADESKGTGVLSSSWPAPSGLYKLGYAGGIGPSNVDQVLTSITEVVGSSKTESFWIDMESGLRSTKNNEDVFDLEKCYKIIEVVCAKKLMIMPSYL